LPGAVATSSTKAGETLLTVRWVAKYNVGMNEQRGLRVAEHDEPMSAASAGKAVYICCGLIYAILCAPAISARGYPPIDAGWFAVTFLWVAAIPLSLIFDTRPFPQRLRGLSIYCLATAFIDAGTATIVVPRHVTLPEMLVMTIFYGPIHLLVGMLVEIVSQGVRRMARSMFKGLSAGSMRLVQSAAFLVLVLLSCSFPFAFRAYNVADLRSRGRLQAEQDWNAGRAEMRVGRGDYFGPVTHRFDPASGLKIRDRSDPFESPFSLAYRSRVAELLAERGTPEWSMKKHIPADDDLVAMFDSRRMEKITKFPYEVNANIVLIRHGTISRWKTTFSNTSGFLAIATPQAFVGVGCDRCESSERGGYAAFTFGDANDCDRPQNEPVFVGRLPKYPQVIFVRSSTDWIGAFHESGKLLSSADRSSGTVGRPSIMER
jgi:hypothetical protein